MEEKYLASEQLVSFRDDARIFLKLDLLYLASGGAVIAALKFNRYELPSLLGDFSLMGVIVAFLLLCFFDARSAEGFQNEWIAVTIGSGKRQHANKLVWWARHQTAFHFLFIAVVVTGAVAFAHGMTYQRENFAAKARIQKYVTFFIGRHGRPPNDIEELRTAYPIIKTSVDTLGSETVVLVHLGGTKYKLIFAGRDKQIGTDDDEEASDEIDFNEAYERLTCQERDDCKK